MRFLKIGIVPQNLSSQNLTTEKDGSTVDQGQEKESDQARPRSDQRLFVTE